MHWSAHAHQDRTDGFGPAQTVKQFVGDVSRLEIGEDQYVRPAAQPRKRIGLLHEFGNGCGIGHDLAVEGESRIGFSNKVSSPAHFLAEWMLGAPEVREREHGYTRLYIEAAGFLCSAKSDLGQVFGCGLDVDRNVSKEVKIGSLCDHGVQGGDLVQTLAHFDDLQSRA